MATSFNLDQRPFVGALDDYFFDLSWIVKLSERHNILFARVGFERAAGRTDISRLDRSNDFLRRKLIS